MKLLNELLAEAGADLGNSFTVVPSFGGYFKGVKRVDEYLPEGVTVCVGNRRLKVVGEKLVIEKYFDGDLFIKGEISGVNFE